MKRKLTRPRFRNVRSDACRLQLLIGNSQIEWTLKGGSNTQRRKAQKYLEDRARAKDKGEKERIPSPSSAMSKYTHTELISGEELAYSQIGAALGSGE